MDQQAVTISNILQDQTNNIVSKTNEDVINSLRQELKSITKIEAQTESGFQNITDKIIHKNDRNKGRIL